MSGSRVPYNIPQTVPGSDIVIGGNGPNSAAVVGLSGMAFSQILPNGVFYVDQNRPAVYALPFGQDIFGPPPAAIVQGIETIPIVMGTSFVAGVSGYPSAFSFPCFIPGTSAFNGTIQWYPGTSGAFGQVLTWGVSGYPTWSSVSGGSPTGAAGGDLSGTYPNPTVISTSGNSFFVSTPNVILIGKRNATSVTATISAGVATVTHTGHGYATGDWVVMSGATSSGSIGDFNQMHKITVTGANTYTFTTTATGTISTPVEQFWFSGARSLNVNLVSNITRSSAGVYVLTFKNTQSDAFFSIMSEASSSASSCIFTLSAGSPPTTAGFTANYFNTGGTAVDANQYLMFSMIGII